MDVSSAAPGDTGVEELVLRSDAGGVATLTLNRPDKLNALTEATFVALARHLEAIDGDPHVRCVVLTGAGRSFCAGHDLVAIDEASEGDPTFEADVVDRLEALAQPTVAKIRGHCLTGGLELALGCDLLVAATTAQLGDTHGQWGLVPAWGMSVRLPERVGPAHAKELMFTSRRIDGARAHAIDLVDVAVADADLDAAVASLAAEIVGNSAGTNRIVKRLMADARVLGRSEALRRERTLPYGLPDDLTERVAAFTRRVAR